MNKRNHLFHTAFFMLALSCASCTTSTSLMNKSLLQGTESNDQAALALTEFLKKSDDYKLRGWAMRSLSYFHEVPEETLTTLERILVKSHSTSDKIWAAYALGQLRRQESLSYYFTALKQKPNDKVDYYVLEALARQISVFNDNPDLSVELLTALNSYISQIDHTPPTMYSLLDEYVSTLSNLVLAMEKLLEQNPPEKRNDKAREELYTSIYKLFHSIDRKQEQLLADFGHTQLSLEKAFQAAYKGVDPSYRAAYLLYSWYAGELGHNPELASIASKELIPWISHSDVRIRQLVIWALLRTEIYHSPAKNALLAHIAQTEIDSNILQMVAAYSAQNGKPDAIQQLLGLEVRQ